MLGEIAANLAEMHVLAHVFYGFHERVDVLSGRFHESVGVPRRRLFADGRKFAQLGYELCYRFDVSHAVS